MKRLLVLIFPVINISRVSRCGTNLFIEGRSYLHWWHAWSSRALAACKPPWLPLWSSLCCTLCPTWTQPEPPPGPHKCSGRPLSGSVENVLLGVSEGTHFLSCLWAVWAQTNVGGGCVAEAAARLDFSRSENVSVVSRWGHRFGFSGEFD